MAWFRLVDRYDSTMWRRVWRPATLSLCTLAGLSGWPPAFAEYEQQRAELRELREQLQAIQAEVREDRRTRDRLGESLAELDRRVGETAQRLERVRRDRAAVRERVTRLQSEYDAESARLQDHKEALAVQLQEAYMAGGEGRLRLILAGRDPAVTQRLLVYHDYFREARTERIGIALGELRVLADLRAELRREQERLEELEELVARERGELERRRRERRLEQERLAERIEERLAAEEQLHEDVAAQEALLDRLRTRLEDIPDEFAAVETLAAARGRLPWPVEGTVEARFGSKKKGDLQRTGIVVAAEAGARVRSVAAGRVVFSDWLRGLGLLVIIDHGDGYLTLYGHNDALYVDLGDWVDGGEVVATVGSSGTRTEPGLYFEIREGELPRNPMAWLR